MTKTPVAFVPPVADEPPKKVSKLFADNDSDDEEEKIPVQAPKVTPPTPIV